MGQDFENRKSWGIGVGATIEKVGASKMKVGKKKHFGFNQENQESRFFFKSWFEPPGILVQPGITRNPGFLGNPGSNQENQESWFFWKSWFEPGILVEVVESWFNQENQESWFFWKSWFEPGILVEVVESWFNQENQESWLILVQPGITRNPGSNQE